MDFLLLKRGTQSPTLQRDISWVLLSIKSIIYQTTLNHVSSVNLKTDK